MITMSLLVHRFQSHSFELWVALVEALWPVFLRRMDIAAIGRRNLEGRGMLEHDNTG
jgi:hypothetical protein